MSCCVVAWRGVVSGAVTRGAVWEIKCCVVLCCAVVRGAVLCRDVV